MVTGIDNSRMSIEHAVDSSQSLAQKASDAINSVLGWKRSADDATGFVKALSDTFEPSLSEYTEHSENARMAEARYVSVGVRYQLETGLNDLKAAPEQNESTTSEDKPESERSTESRPERP